MNFELVNILTHIILWDMSNHENVLVKLILFSDFEGLYNRGWSLEVLNLLFSYPTAMQFFLHNFLRPHFVSSTFKGSKCIRALHTEHEQLKRRFSVVFHKRRSLDGGKKVETMNKSIIEFFRLKQYIKKSHLHKNISLYSID